MGNMLRETKKLQGTTTEHLLKGSACRCIDLKISVKIPHLKVHKSGTPQIQWLRICTSITGDMGSTLVRELRIHRLCDPAKINK